MEINFPERFDFSLKIIIERMIIQIPPCSTTTTDIDKLSTQKIKAEKCVFN